MRYSPEGYPLTKQGVRDLGKPKISRPRTVIPPETDGSRDLDYKPPFKLMVSEDCGCHYYCAATADDPEDFAKRAHELDQEMLRWYIQDSAGTMTHVGLIHRHIINLLDRLNNGA